MPYATRGQIEARLPSVELLSSQFDNTVAEALLSADTQINTALADSYVTPFSPVPVSISQLAADFAAAFVLRSTTESEESVTAAKLMQETAERQLAKMVKAGVPELIESGTDVKPAANLGGYHSAYGQTSEIAQFWPT